jgi:hypothetical protein
VGTLTTPNTVGPRDTVTVTREASQVQDRSEHLPTDASVSGSLVAVAALVGGGGVHGVSLGWCVVVPTFCPRGTPPNHQTEIFLSHVSVTVLSAPDIGHIGQNGHSGTYPYIDVHIGHMVHRGTYHTILVHMGYIGHSGT